MCVARAGRVRGVCVLCACAYRVRCVCLVCVALCTVRVLALRVTDALALFVPYNINTSVKHDFAQTAINARKDTVTHFQIIKFQCM